MPTRRTPPTSRACVGVRRGTAGFADALVRRDRLDERRVVEPLDRADRVVVRRNARKTVIDGLSRLYRRAPA
jgi:hypothetical protein